MISRTVTFLLIFLMNIFLFHSLNDGASWKKNHFSLFVVFSKIYFNSNLQMILNIIHIFIQLRHYYFISKFAVNFLIEISSI